MDSSSQSSGAKPHRFRYLPNILEYFLDGDLIEILDELGIISCSLNMDGQKSVHTIVLDTGAVIKNEPPVSTLLKQCESLVTIPEIVSEIMDAAARSRFETTLRPFLTIKSPHPNSIKFVTDFARRTGDLAVLSRPDISIIALTYELECERNGGDWRLRNSPGQKRMNGAPPTKILDTTTESVADPEPQAEETLASNAESNSSSTKDTSEEQNLTLTSSNPTNGDTQEGRLDAQNADAEQRMAGKPAHEIQTVATDLQGLSMRGDEASSALPPKVDPAQGAAPSQSDNSDSDSDSEGWITPSNLKKKQDEDAATSTVQTLEPKTMQVAVLTTDFAMQNVILQINLNLLSPSMNRVKHLKTYVLRCHACFQVCKDMTKQFCPRCGQPNLTRVACSTNSNGEFKLHLKKNMQWNTRGDRFSIPKPSHGSANRQVYGGGKGGWGHNLILAEDQKEYQKAANEEKRTKERSLMDPDYLPSILTGDRGRAGGRPKVGAGRNINSRKR